MLLGRFALILAAASSAAPAQGRSFQPAIEWSASGGFVVDAPADYYAGPVLGSGANGSVLLLGSDGRQDSRGVALAVLARAGEPVSIRQFGDNGASHRLLAERVLSMDARMALVRYVEEQGPSDSIRRILLAYDLENGGVRWATPIVADAAESLADGDALVLSGGTLLRIHPDGSPRWVRHVAEFADPGETRQPIALHVTGSRAVVVASALASAIGSNSTPVVRLLAFDIGSGDMAWQAVVPVGTVCASGVVGAALVVVSPGAIDAAGYAEVAVHRRALGDGAALPGSTLPGVPARTLHCRLLDLDGRGILATSDSQGDSTLSATTADGAILWRAGLAARVRPMLVPAPGSSDVIQLSAVPGENQFLLERRRGTDGALVWAVNSPAVTANQAPIVVSVSPQRAHVGSIGAVTDFALEDGTELGVRSLLATTRRLLPYRSAFVGEIPIDAAASSDGGILIRRLDPASQGVIAWSQTVAGPQDFPWPANNLSMHDAGQGRMLVLANYLVLRDSGWRNDTVVALLDVADGRAVWRRDLRDLSTSGTVVLAADQGSVLLSNHPCEVPAGCASRPVAQLRAAADGAPRWQRSIDLLGASIAGEAVVGLAQDGAGRAWQYVNAGGASVAWTQAVAPGMRATHIAMLPGPDFVASTWTRANNTDVVEVERRTLSDGLPRWSFRAGLPGERISVPVMQIAEGGTAFVSAHLVGPETQLQGMTRPLLHRINGETGSALWTSRPALVGDRWWSLRLLRQATGSPIERLRSVRYLESISRPFNSRVALSSIDRESGSIGGEHLVERRFDDALLGDTAVELVGVLPSGSLMAVDALPDRDGLRRRTLMRLAAPAAHQGDLRLRLLDAELGMTGFGPSRRIRVEVDNLGTVPASDAEFGVAPWRDRDPLHAVFAGCSVVVGSASCPADLTQRRVSLAPGATLRLEWEMFDSGYRNAVPVAGPVPAGARIFIDAPWDYADTQAGNNIVEVALRLGAFGDGFE